MASAYPAPVKATFGTRHVVTTSVFLGGIATVGALYHIFLFYVFVDFGVSNIITSYSWMANRSTFEACLIVTLIAAGIAFISTTTFLSCDEAATAIDSAPFEIGVSFYLDISYKFLIFLYHLF